MKVGYSFRRYNHIREFNPHCWHCYRESYLFVKKNAKLALLPGGPIPSNTISVSHGSIQLRVQSSSHSTIALLMIISKDINCAVLMEPDTGEL